MISSKVLKKSKNELLRGFNLLLIFTFALLPLMMLLVQIKSADITRVFNDPNFFAALRHSVIYSFGGAGIATLLALVLAYLLNRAKIKRKWIYVLLLTLPMLVPTISIGLGIRQLFGKKGFLDLIFQININGYGYLGLFVGSIVVAFPICFLIIYDALQYENKSIYDVAHTLGINKVSSFFKLTLPYLKLPLISAFFAASTMIFADYGIPMEVAGKLKTLPMYLYESITSVSNYGRASIIGLCLLMPAIISFIIDFFNKEQNTEESIDNLIKPRKAFNVFTIIAILAFSFFLFVPQLSFIATSVFTHFPNDLTLTLDNFVEIFTKTYGASPVDGIINSLIIALLSGLIGTIFAFIVAYYAARIEGKMGKILHFLAIATIAIPGIVLGIGYIFLFKNTKGIFYGTIMILVVVNIIHFMGSPYLMAKNCLTKINKSYEIVGDTLGIKRHKILLHVILPNSLSTLLEMFSYFFLNSMITISAVAFLCTYDNEPLSIMISKMETSGNIELQAVISVIIFLINIIAKSLIVLLKTILTKHKRKEENNMILTRYQFNLLAFLDFKGKREYSQRFLSDALTISVGTTNKLINELLTLNYIQLNDINELSITDTGYKALEQYRVKGAIILAAGFGSRMAPVTLDTPKPLVMVNGVRIIDTLIDALVAQGITNIKIVRGYKKQKFDVLLEKYPFIKFIDNDEFNITNNISSLLKAIDYIDQCYICEADLLITNPKVIQKYEYSTNYLGAKVDETDDWCFLKSNKFISAYKLGGEDCYQAFGISYWDENDSKKLKNDIVKLYHSKGGKEYFWEAAVLKVYRKNYQVEVRECHKSDIIEIDNFNELTALDKSYTTYPQHEDFDV